jgi:hypothetical protein
LADTNIIPITVAYCFAGVAQTRPEYGHRRRSTADCSECTA